MPIKINSNLDYQHLCNELGITIEELLYFSQNKESLNRECTQTPVIFVIDEFISNLVKLCKNNKRSDETLKTYENILVRFKAFINELDPKMTLNDLNEDLLNEFLINSTPRNKTSEKISLNTYNKYQAIVRSLLLFGYERSYISRDLRYKFEIKNSHTLPRHLSDEQVKQALSAALQRTYGYRNRAIMIFLLGTGCRISELVNLKVKDFNITEGLIYIYNGKGKKDRVIPMFKEVKRAITQYLRISNLSIPLNECEGYLFTRSEGNIRDTFVSTRSIQYLVRNVFDSIGLDERYTVHSFRHTFAVNCLIAGMQMHYLSQIMGHEDPRTTQIYTQLLPLELKEEVNKHYPFPFETLIDQLL